MQRGRMGIRFWLLAFGPEPGYNKRKRKEKGGIFVKNGADRYRGCLLGMSIGDAMGAPVDAKRYSNIRDTYGPRGLRGYDIANAPAEITS